MTARYPNEILDEDDDMMLESKCGCMRGVCPTCNPSGAGFKVADMQMLEWALLYPDEERVPAWFTPTEAIPALVRWVLNGDA